MLHIFHLLLLTTLAYLYLVDVTANAFCHLLDLAAHSYFYLIDLTIHAFFKDVITHANFNSIGQPLMHIAKYSILQLMHLSVSLDVIAHVYIYLGDMTPNAYFHPLNIAPPSSFHHVDFNVHVYFTLVELIAHATFHVLNGPLLMHVAE